MKPSHILDNICEVKFILQVDKQFTGELLRNFSLVYSIQFTVCNLKLKF